MGKGSSIERPLQRPDLFIATKTKNILMKKGSTLIYVKVVSKIKDIDFGQVTYVPMPGARRNYSEVTGVVPYFGVIDDETMANIMIYGSDYVQ